MEGLRAIQKSGCYNQGKTAGEVKESVSHKNLLQEGRAETCVAKCYKSTLESEGDCWNTPLLSPSHSISCGLKLGSLPWPVGCWCLFLHYTKPNCRFPICLRSSWGGSMMSSLPEISCMMDVTTGRGQAQGGTEDAPLSTPSWPGHSWGFPWGAQAGFLWKARASEHALLK